MGGRVSHLFLVGRHTSLVLVLVLAMVAMVVFAWGCGSQGSQLGVATTVNLNQLWEWLPKRRTSLPMVPYWLSLR